MDSTVKEYDAKIDTKKRITLRGPAYDYYHVVEFPNGRIELEPKALVESFVIAEETLQMIDKSMNNLRNGVTLEPIDFSDMDIK